MSLTSAVYRALVMARHPRAFSLSRRGISWEEYRELRRPWLLNQGIRTIVDIGANTGQFARLAHEIWPAARIYSLEPLPDAFAQLQQALPPSADFHPLNLAAGAEAGELDFLPCEHSPSSSFLRATRLHHEAFAGSTGEQSRTLRVPVRPLDDLMAELEWSPPLLLKIDVQGFEDRVLAGAEATLRQASAALVETSFTELYEGQALFPEVYSRMLALGYRYRGSIRQMLSAVDESVVQADSIFVRESDSA